MMSLPAGFLTSSGGTWTSAVTARRLGWAWAYLVRSFDHPGGSNGRGRRKAHKPGTQPPAVRCSHFRYAVGAEFALGKSRANNSHSKAVPGVGIMGTPSRAAALNRFRGQGLFEGLGLFILPFWVEIMLLL
jgi:hypothetical protein